MVVVVWASATEDPIRVSGPPVPRGSLGHARREPDRGRLRLRVVAPASSRRGSGSLSSTWGELSSAASRVSVVVRHAAENGAVGNGNLWAVRDHARMEGTQQRGWRVVVDGESRPTSRGRAHVEVLGVTARSTLVIDFGRSCVKAAVAYHDRDRIAHLHGVPAYLLQHMFGERDDYLTVDVAARVFDRVRHQAASLRSGLVPTSLWLTHRTRDDESRVSILAQAARLAGLAEPTYMAEPLAGAACFDGLGAMVGQYVAVLDFGQGSFDAALLQRTHDGHAVIADWCPADRPSGAKITDRLVSAGLGQVGRRPAKPGRTRSHTRAGDSPQTRERAVVLGPTRSTASPCRSAEAVERDRFDP